MRGRQIRRQRDDVEVGSRLDSDLAEECEAFLAGQWAEQRRAKGLVVPTWRRSIKQPT